MKIDINPESHGNLGFYSFPISFIFMNANVFIMEPEQFWILFISSNFNETIQIESLYCLFYVGHQGLWTESKLKEINGMENMHNGSKYWSAVISETSVNLVIQ